MDMGILEGDEVVVMFMWNRQPIGEVTHNAISNTELVTNVYTEDEKSLMLMYEAVGATYEAIKFHMAKPQLRKLVEERIAQLKAEQDDSEAGECPYPTVHDVPF